MDKLRKILVPTNFSNEANNALDYTINFVNLDQNIEIILLYISDAVIGSSEQEILLAKVAKMKQDFGRKLRTPLTFTTRTGNLVETILEVQKEKAVDLIIMGTKGSEKDDESSRTNTSRLTLEADCPVLVVPENTKEFALKKIALTLGKEIIEDSPKLSVLLDITRRFNAQVHVLTIQGKNGHVGYSQADETNENILEYYLETFYSHHQFMDNEDVEKGIFDYVNDKEIEMLVIIPRNHATKSKPSEGRLTNLLALHSDVPLLTI